MRNPKVYGLVALVLVCCSNCTAALHSHLKDRGNPAREVIDNNGIVRASYVKDIEKNGVNHAVVYLFDARVPCNDNAPLQLLLPLANDNNLPAELTETKDVGQREISGGKPVSVVVDNTTVDGRLYLDRIPKIVSELEPWPGYPGKIFFSTNRGGDASGVLVAYRVGGKTEDIRFRLVRADLKWICRSRQNQVVQSLLYPLAFVADLATSPLVMFGANTFGILAR